MIKVEMQLSGRVGGQLVIRMARRNWLTGGRGRLDLEITVLQRLYQPLHRLGRAHHLIDDVLDHIVL